MKNICLLILLSAAGLQGLAQAAPTSVKFNKATTPALVLRVPYSESIAEGAIIRKLKEIGYKPETSGALLWKKNTVDGYYAFKDVVLQGLDGRVADLYFKVDQVSRKEKGTSNIYMIVGQGPEQFASSENDTALFAAGGRFLNGLEDYSAGYKMDVDIEAQEEAFKNAEKKYNKMKDDERELEEKLRNNRQQQENQLKITEAEKAKLEELRQKKLNKP